MQISALGDSALLVDFSDETSDRARLLERALDAAAALRAAEIDGVKDVTSSYASAAVFFAAAADAETIAAQVRNVTASAPNESQTPDRIVEVPVSYDDEFALDLARVASDLQLHPREIIALHSAATYTVAAIGFMPGFPYLAGLDEKLRTRRLDEPRVRVPAGSVGIANDQTGVYPLESPGGWNIIGRTPLRLFDAAADPPCLLQPGDRVRFVSISRAQFAQM